MSYQGIKNDLITFYCGIGYYWVDALSFIQPILYWWTFGLSPNSALKKVSQSVAFFFSLFFFFFCVCVFRLLGESAQSNIINPVSQSVLLLSRIRLFARQASLSITNSKSLLKLMSIELVMPCNHFTLCRPLLLLPSIFPSIKVFSNESALRIR